MRRREGIKRSLRDITPVSYEEYDNSWDLEDQSKRCKRAANCLLAGSECRGESESISKEKGDLPLRLPPGTVAEMDRRAGTRKVERKPISDEEADMLVRLPPGTGAEMGR